MTQTATQPAPIHLTVTTADPMLAAMLRLIGAHYVAVPLKPDGHGGIAVDLPAAAEAVVAEKAALDALDDARREDAAAIRVDADDDEAIDIMPPDADAVYRPLRAGDADDDNGRGESDIQLSIAARLGDNQALADVARHLLRPLAGRGWPIDGNREAVLTRLAEEFCTYPPRHLSAAASRLLAGRHTHFPDQGEIYEALGRALKPGTTAPQTAKAA